MGSLSHQREPPGALHLTPGILARQGGRAPNGGRRAIPSPFFSLPVCVCGWVVGVGGGGHVRAARRLCSSAAQRGEGAARVVIVLLAFWAAQLQRAGPDDN